MPHLIKHCEKIALAGKFQHAVAVLQNVGHGCRQLIGKFEFIPRFSLFTGARKTLPELIAVLPQKHKFNYRARVLPRAVKPRR